ncbi:MAG TPA: CoA transferase, partial [Pseudonocardiaceae bacterium]
PQGRAVAAEPLVALEHLGGGDAEPLPGGLRGVRVLDLTRVIAGPTAGRVLAGWGAEVLRVDPPGFDEVPALVLETTTGKRATALDLRANGDRARFEELVRGASVMLTGYRPGALTGLGYPPERLTALRPGLVIGTLSAYGETGPWAGRRGFDSLVQLTSGLADEARRAAGVAGPVALPAQALDHLTGWLLAAGVAVALRRRATAGGGHLVRTVLARTARWLDDLGRVPDGLRLPEPDAVPPMVEFDGPLGRTRHVAQPGAIGDERPLWTTPPVPLGGHEPAWATRWR